jgi:hypothetical protein
MSNSPHPSPDGAPARRRFPRSFKELTPANHFNPRTFFREMVWKALLTRAPARNKRPDFPKLTHGHHGIDLDRARLVSWCSSTISTCWSIRISRTGCFLLKRIKRAGLRIRDLPPIDLVLLTHAHFDHFHRPTLRRLPAPKIAVMPWGVGELARGLGFERIIELQTVGKFFARRMEGPRSRLANHWGARTLRDLHRGYGGFVLEHRVGSVYHAGDSAYFEGFKEIGKRLAPEVALLPIGAYYPDTFRNVHMGPGRSHECVPRCAGEMVRSHALRRLQALLRGPRRTAALAARNRHREQLLHHVKIIEEGVPQVF